MLTLDSPLRIPAHVVFSIVGEDAFLLNTLSNDYFSLEAVGTRLWEFLKDGKTLREGYNLLLGEYDVEPGALEKDLLELVEKLVVKGLVEIVEQQD
jgi:hypothetical protein